MAKSRRKRLKKNKPRRESLLSPTEWNQIWAIILAAFSILVVVSLVSHDPQDLPYQTSQVNPFPENFAGLIGAYISSALLLSIGKSAYLVPVLFLIWGYAKLAGRRPQKLYVKSVGTAVLLLVSSGILSLLTAGDPTASFDWGGTVGLAISEWSVRYLNLTGAYLLAGTLFILSLLLATEFMVIQAIKAVARFFAGLIPRAQKVILTRRERPQPPKRSPPPAKPIITRHLKPEAKPVPKPLLKPKPAIRPKLEPALIPVAKEREKQPQPPKPKPTVVSAPITSTYQLPDANLLNSPPPASERVMTDNLEANSQILEDTLRDFGIEVKVIRVDQGPIITRYELQPAPGVKITRITSLADDIALVMKATSVRIIAPIPGKSAVGVEVPNSAKTLVYLREIVESKEFKADKSPLTLALGKDTAGKPLVADLGDMPHLLIAGTTGSGKTVCVNAIITSLLFRNRPEELKFLMVDPKMVELATFNGLPHLLCPVVTGAKKAAAALEWVVSQMEERYKLLAKAGARNIDAYNQKLPEERLSYIIVIIDELADLMVVAKGDVENAITRLAQLSRAVGIHIILATQRPSVDVVTGIIKANFPARISFQVASKVDSRTVLDANGADKLLGKGDMLFMQPGSDKLIRGQSSLVSDQEIESIASFIKHQKDVEYNQEILEVQEKKSSHHQRIEKDELFDDAVKMILETGQASVSMLQRRLKLSYQRAGRIIDMMEEEGVIGPHRGSKPREILVSNYSSPQDERVENDNRAETQAGPQ